MRKKKAIETQKSYLECERHCIFLMLMLVGGYLGAFTYTLRGGVFCNAQTANVLIMGIMLGQGEFQKACYYLIPICAYIVGTIISEALPTPIRRRELVRRDTLLVLIEIVIIFLPGLIPDALPFQFTQVIVNIMMAMQYNTFRQAEGISMATTFCTNHIRQIGIHLYKSFRHREDEAFQLRLVRHLQMLAMFAIGSAASTWLGMQIGSISVWGAILPLLAVLFRLLRADLVREREHFDMLPKGH